MYWHVYPLGATGAPIRPDTGEGPLGGPDRPVEHRLRRLVGWLDHVRDLGLDGLVLGPVFASESHGYDTVDHLRIDPRLGDDADFDLLVEEAGRRGLALVLDGVFNHVGRSHPAFARLRDEGPDAPTAGMFRVDWAGWEPGRDPDAEVFEGHGGLVDLDHAADEVAELVASVMTHWLDRGAAGWRLDAAYAVPPEFWTRVLPGVRERHPDAWFTGEVIHGDAAGYVEASGLDSLTQYELWQGIWHGIRDRNLYETAHAIERHNALLRTFVPTTFVGNHDVTRIATAVGEQHVPHALAVLLTVAGVPTIYAGDEYGATGAKEERIGGDDAVRPELPPEPPADDDLDPAARSVLALHRTLLAARADAPWVTRAHTDVTHLENTSAVLRTGAGEDGFVTALNLGDEPVRLPAADARERVAGEGDLADGAIALPAHGMAVFRR